MAIRCRAIALAMTLWILIAACGTPEPTAILVPPSPTTIPPTTTSFPPTATPVPPAVTPTMPAPTATPGISPEASAYLDEALDIMQEHALYRDQIDWESLRTTTYQMVGEARIPAETYEAIRSALRELGDHHSHFMTPVEVAQFKDGTMSLANPDPRGELLEEGLGYLFLPGFAGMGEAANEQATRIQQIIADIDAQAPCGWIVDLRENIGGSMWPMLAGIGPVLGEGRVGAFVYPNRQQVDWTYASGQAIAGDTLETEVNGLAYELAEPSPPVAVLTGPRTISSGEAIAVAFRGRPGTRSFGESTAGLSTATKHFPLSDGAWIMLTVSKYADGTGQVYGVSLTPDQMVRPQGAGADPALQAAIDWLLQQPTCTVGYVPVFEPANCRFYKPPGFDPECGYLVVPEDRTKPNGAQVRLHVAIFRSRSQTPEPDPLIYLTGGGGGNELDNTIRYLNDGNDAILDHRDFIMYNQRGAKYAKPYLQCKGYAEFMAQLVPRNLPRNTAEAQEIEFFLDCRDSLVERGIDLNRYDTAVNADDLNDLRIALGYDQVNIYGTSYGTRLALEILRRHGQHIRSAILDSVYPPNVHFFSDYWANCWKTFEHIFNACAADADCSSRYPGIQELLYQVLDDLHANPRTMRYGGTGTEITFVYDDAAFVDAMYLFPYIAQPGMVPFMIQRASQGDFSPIESLIPWAMAVVPSDSIADGVQNSILCREETPFDSYERLAELGNQMPPQIARGSVSSFSYDLCAEWGVAPADAAEREPVVSDVPTLILTGEYDPITPPGWARLAAETLTTSYYYEFPGLGHGVMRSNRCGFQIGHQFLADPYTVPDASCIDRLPGVEFK